MAAKVPIEVGDKVGNYRIVARLGEGGMGTVFVAEHPVIGRKVALKALNSEFSQDLEIVQRFFTEARIVTEIRHENIVEVFDLGKTEQGLHYFTMELLEGQSLGAMLRKDNALAVHEAVHIAMQIAAALGAAHARNVVHRDLKPDNVFLITRKEDPHFVKVLDFGVAKLLGPDYQVSLRTKTGLAIGTPYYMSPEQCEGRRDVDGRADVYSLGVLLYQMLTGCVPFGGEAFGQIMMAHIQHDPPPPRTLRPGIAATLEGAVMRALAKRPEQRYAGMNEFRDAIRRFERAGALTPPIVGGARPRKATEPASEQATVMPEAVTDAVHVAPQLLPGRPATRQTVVRARSRRAWLAAIAVVALLGGAAAGWRMIQRRWRPVTLVGGPSPRSLHLGVAAGSSMLVWGGVSGGRATNTGGIYDPLRDKWRTLAPQNAPQARKLATAVWTGSEMIVWGGSDHTSLASGGRYDAETGTWRATQMQNAPAARERHSAVWTGSEMIVWGGFSSRSGGCLSDGGRYRPASDVWEPVTPAAPTARERHVAVWTGSQMLIWGGRGPDGRPLGSGFNFTPNESRWLAIAAASAPTARSEHSAVWTGSELIVWGGTDGARPLPDGARYNPQTDQWIPVSTVNAPSARHGHTALWNGRDMIVWGGVGSISSGGGDAGASTGALYDPVNDHWRPMATAGGPKPRTGHIAVWITHAMIVWGGAGATELGDGARFTP